MICFKFTIVAALTLQIASAARPKRREDRPIHRLLREITDAASQTPHRRRLPGWSLGFKKIGRAIKRMGSGKEKNKEMERQPEPSLEDDFSDMPLTREEMVAQVGAVVNIVNYNTDESFQDVVKEIKNGYLYFTNDLDDKRKITDYHVKPFLIKMPDRTRHQVFVGLSEDTGATVRSFDNLKVGAIVQKKVDKKYLDYVKFVENEKNAHHRDTLFTYSNGDSSTFENFQEGQYEPFGIDVLKPWGNFSAQAYIMNVNLDSRKDSRESDSSAFSDTPTDWTYDGYN